MVGVILRVDLAGKRQDSGLVARRAHHNWTGYPPLLGINGSLDITSINRGHQDELLEW